MKLFDIQNRIGNDDCALGFETNYNKSVSDYMLFNNYQTNQQDDNKCVMNFDKVSEFANNNHMMVRDGYGNTNGCFIDNDSDVRKFNLTSDKKRDILNTRMYRGGPNLSRGSTNPEVESKLIQGNMSTNDCPNRSLDVFIPMLPCLKKSIQDPNNIIESWQRGGDSTRDTLKQEDFLSKNGYIFDGKVWLKKQM
jgi:hypothetical protein|tara:strand:- start:1205 stop:1786 length:582 start_codon:yes stop_codon:yes gene_type:complete